MNSLVQSLLDVIPKIKTKVQLAAFLIAVGLVILIRDKSLGGILAQISIGGIALVVIVFAQVFTYIKDFPEQKRSQTVITLFSISCAFVLILFGIVAYGLYLDSASQRATKNPEPIAAEAAQGPADQKNLNDVLDVAYSKKASAQEAGTSPGIAFDLHYKAIGTDADNFKTLTNGDTLSRQHEYRFAIYPTNTQFVYILQVDSNEKLNWLFPRNTADAFSAENGLNPVTGNQWLIVPNGWYTLDDQAGKETVYVISTYKPWYELETALQKYLENQRQGKVQPNALRTRGIGGVRTNEKTPSNNQFGSVSEIIRGLDNTVVVEKWFYHSN